MVVLLHLLPAAGGGSLVMVAIVRVPLVGALRFASSLAAYEDVH